MPMRGGVAGAALLGLLDEHDVGPRRGQLLDLLGDLLGAVADDDGRALGSQPLEGVDDVQHHRPAADQVQRLGPRRPHPRALAGGEDDRRDASSPCYAVMRRGIALARPSAPGRGLEPLYTEPKSAVLPLNDPGIGRQRLTASSPVPRYRGGAAIRR